MTISTKNEAPCINLTALDMISSAENGRSNLQYFIIINNELWAYNYNY